VLKISSGVFSAACSSLIFANPPATPAGANASDDPVAKLDFAIPAGHQLNRLCHLIGQKTRKVTANEAGFLLRVDGTRLRSRSGRGVWTAVEQGHGARGLFGVITWLCTRTALAGGQIT